MAIYVIRHGQTELNKREIVNGQIDESLAPEGFEQAVAAIALIPRSVTHIYASSLLRARQTANIFGEALNVPVYIQDELSEIHMGSLAGKSWEEMDPTLELKKKHRAVKFDYRPYGGESVADVKKRLIAFLQSIRKKHQDNEVLVVTHGGIIRMLRLLESGNAVYETEKNVSLLTLDLDKVLA